VDAAAVEEVVEAEEDAVVVVVAVEEAVVGVDVVGAADALLFYNVQYPCCHKFILNGLSFSFLSFVYL